MNKQRYLLTSASNHSGFSNKMHAWANAYYLAEQNGGMTIVQDWPGDTQTITLPNTISIQDLPNNLEWLDVNTNTLQNSVVLPNASSIKLTCGYNYNRAHSSNINYKFLFKQMQFNHSVLSDILALTDNPNLIGIHIRRTDFHPPTQTDLDFVGMNTQVHENWFTSVMKDLLKSNNKIKFYLATENFKQFSHLYNNFDIVDRSVFNIPESNRPLKNFTIALHDLIDLFVLKHVKSFIETPRSSFSHLASLLNNNPTITSNTYKGYFYHTQNY